MTDGFEIPIAPPTEVDEPTRALPEGALTIAIGLIIAGISTYAFFRVGAAALGGDTAFAPIAAMWFAMFALAPGCYAPLEQELSRALAHRHAIGDGGKPVVRKVLLITTAIAAIVTSGVMLGSGWLSRSYFDGSWVMVGALMTAFLAYAPVHLARGICSGLGRFGPFAFVVASDGVVKIIATVALMAIGVSAVGAYAFVIALAPLVAVAVIALRGQLNTEDGSDASWREVGEKFGWLLVGTACAAALLNAGPITANILATTDEADAVTRFGYGVLLSRVPLFMFAAIQATLLPRLSRLAARREYSEFARGLRLLAAVVGSIGAIGTVGAYLLGPWALRLVYHAELSGRTLAMLALSSAIYMLSLATSQAVLALEDHAIVAAGWVASIFAFVATVIVIGGELFFRIELALVISAAVSCAVFLMRVSLRLRDLTS